MLNFILKQIYKFGELRKSYQKLWNNQIGILINRKILAQQEATKKELERQLEEANKRQGNWDEVKELKRKLAEQKKEIEGNPELKKVGTKKRLEMFETSVENLRLEIESMKQL